MNKLSIRYEDAAETKTVTGWACKTCGRFWERDEHMARYCCATDFPCRDCDDSRTEKSRIRCDACQAKLSDANWSKLARVEWDGETPLCLFDGDRFFFGGPEEVADYMEEHEIAREAARFVLCEEDNGRDFAMADHLEDSIPHDGDAPDSREIDKAVNDWIKAHSPFSWYPTNKAVSAESLPDVFPGPKENIES